jgi:signal transduction histidine kinase
VTGDRARLAQVIDNLLSNALKFTPPGGRIRVRAEIAGGEALVEVADDGPGIGPDDQARLFERFFRTEAAVANAIQGTGLGLAIAKMMVEAHGGAIAVESAEGAGATFRVRLPLRAGRRAPLAALPG